MLWPVSADNWLPAEGLALAKRRRELSTCQRGTEMPIPLVSPLALKFPVQPSQTWLVQDNSGQSQEHKAASIFHFREYGNLAKSGHAKSQTVYHSMT